MPKKKKTETQFVFPRQNQIECPRCKATDTVPYKTDGRIQYRRCVRAICRRRFHVVGEPVTIKPQKGEHADGNTHEQAAGANAPAGGQ